MNNIIATNEYFKRKMFTGSDSSDLIANAENELGISIAPEYKEVLKYFGSLCVKGEEFLGIDCDNYDVVKATNEARKNDKNFPLDMYVIENTSIDGILIIQNSAGELFSYQPNGKVQHVATCLDEYLQTL